MQRAELEVQWQKNGRGKVRAVYFSIEGKNILTKQRWGLMSLGLKETIGNDGKSKSSFRTAQKKIVFMTNFDY